MDKKTSPINLLLIEDNAEDSQLLKQILLKNKFPPFFIEERDRLSTCLDRLRGGDIDIILVDLGLPDSSGLETFGKIQAEVPDIPVIILTGLGDDELALSALKGGAQDFLIKGQIDPRSLPRAIRYAIERKKIEIKLKKANIDLEAEIAERKQVEEKLRETTHLNELLLDSLPHPAMLIRRDRIILAANRIALESGASVGGYCWHDFRKSAHIPEEHKRSMEEHNGKIPPAGIKCAFCLADEALDEKKSLNNRDIETPGQLWDMWWIPIDKDLYLHYVIDITETKLAEKQIKASLEEKEVMLKEIHHRVKNNLQLINSLLNLQARRLKDKQSLAVFEECKNRVNSIALIHEKLYESNDLANIDFSKYIQALTAQFFSSYPVRLSRINLNIAVGNVFLSVNKAIPCALIINELVTNSIKYGFPGEHHPEGEINVELKPTGNGKIALTVADNGAGLPEKVDINDPKTLGMQIINALTKQLRASVQIHRTNGTKFIIEFQIKK